jgi:hypothetical protein
MSNPLFADILKSISTGLEPDEPAPSPQQTAGDQQGSLSTDDAEREALLKVFHYSQLVPLIRRKDIVLYEAHAESLVKEFSSMLRRPTAISDLSRSFSDSMTHYAATTCDDRKSERLNSLCSLMSMDAFAARKAPLAPIAVAALVVASAGLGFTVASAYLKARAAAGPVNAVSLISSTDSAAQLDDAFGLSAAGTSGDGTVLTDVLHAVYLRPDVRACYVMVARVFTSGLDADPEALTTLKRIASDVPIPGDVERKGVAVAVGAVCGGLAAGIFVAMLVHHSHQQ